MNAACTQAPQKKPVKIEFRRIKSRRKYQAAAPEFSHGPLTDRESKQASDASQPGIWTGPPEPSCSRQADAARH